MWVKARQENDQVKRILGKLAEKYIPGTLIQIKKYLTHMVPISVMAMVNSTLNLMDCMMSDKWMNIGKKEARTAKEQAASAVRRAEDDGKEDGSPYSPEELKQIELEVLDNVALPEELQDGGRLEKVFVRCFFLGSFLCEVGLLTVFNVLNSLIGLTPPLIGLIDWFDLFV